MEDTCKGDPAMQVVSIFYKTVLAKRIVNNIEWPNWQLSLFKKCVLEKEGVEPATYKTFKLNRILIKSYPFLKFVNLYWSSYSNGSYLFFVEDEEISTDIVV